MIDDHPIDPWIISRGKSETRKSFTAIMVKACFLAISSLTVAVVSSTTDIPSPRPEIRDAQLVSDIGHLCLSLARSPLDGASLRIRLLEILASDNDFDLQLRLEHMVYSLVDFQTSPHPSLSHVLPSMSPSSSPVSNDSLTPVVIEDPQVQPPIMLEVSEIPEDSSEEPMPLQSETLFSSLSASDFPPVSDDGTTDVEVSERSESPVWEEPHCDPPSESSEDTEETPTMVSAVTAGDLVRTDSETSQGQRKKNQKNSVALSHNRLLLQSLTPTPPPPPPTLPVVLRML